MGEVFTFFFLLFDVSKRLVLLCKHRQGVLSFGWNYSWVGLGFCRLDAYSVVWNSRKISRSFEYFARKRSSEAAVVAKLQLHSFVKMKEKENDINKPKWEKREKLLLLDGKSVTR